MAVRSCFLLLLCCSLRPADTAPARHGETLSLRVAEELPAGSYVGSIRDVARLAAQFPDDHATLRFQLTKPSEFFNVDETSGVVNTAARIDRESLLHASGDNHQCSCRPVATPQHGLFAPAALMRCSCALEVLARSSRWRESRFFPFTVDIVDVNDNVAVWASANVSLFVPEHSLNGTEFKLPAAADPDFLDNGRLDYFVKDDLSKMPFRLQPSASRLSLVVSGNVDRESKNSYRFLLFVKDASNIPRTSSIPVTITVTDINDHRPRFVSSTSEITVSESVTRGTVLHKFEATDADSVSELRYHFDPATMQLAALNAFHLDDVSGEVSLSEPLDRETQAEYTLNVIVTDGQFDAESSLRVIVSDVNDEPPRIDVRSAAADANDTAVFENEPGGTLVAYVWVTDPDRSVAEREPPVHCLLPAGAPFALRPWTHSGPRYGLYTTEPFDAERSRSLELLITCQDGGQPPLSSRKVVNVHVKDVNDNAPSWPSSFHAIVKENSAPSVPLLQLNATDADFGRNGVVHYFLNTVDLRGWSKYSFEIDRLTGRLTARRPLDREDVRSLTIQVLAIDQGTPSLTSYATVNITVEDENDNYPQFSEAVYRFSVIEAAQQNSRVGILQAVDHDATSPNNEVRFRMLRETDPESQSLHRLDRYRQNYTDVPFVVTSNGHVLVSGAIDYEQQQEYAFSVLVTDGGNPTRTSSAVVIVSVEDVNDNSPFWIFPNSTHRVVYCSLYDPISTEIARLQARDTDANQNGELTYILRYGDLLGHLALNAQTGILYLQKKFDAHHVGSHKIVIEVTDHGIHPLRNQAFLDINVTNQASSFHKADSPKPVFPNEKTLVIMLTLIITALFVALLLISVVTFVRMRRRARSRKRSVKAPGDKEHTEIADRYSAVSAKGDSLQSCGSSAERKEFEDLTCSDFVDRTHTVLDAHSDDESVAVHSLALAGGTVKSTSRTLPTRPGKKWRTRAACSDSAKLQQAPQSASLCAVQQNNGGTPVCRLMTTFQRNDADCRQLSVFNSVDGRKRTRPLRASADTQDTRDKDTMWHSMTDSYKKTCRFATQSPVSYSVRGLNHAGVVGASANNSIRVDFAAYANSNSLDASPCLNDQQNPECAGEALSFKPTPPVGSCKVDARDKENDVYQDDSSGEQPVQSPSATRQLEHGSSPRFIRTTLMSSTPFCAPRSDSADSSYV